MRILLLSLLLSPVLCFPQPTEENQAKIDSLKQVIELAEQDTTIIKAWYAWDNLIFRSDPKLDLE